MSQGTPEQIDELRSLSNEIDFLADQNKLTQALSLLEDTLEKAKTIDGAYALFFQGELYGYRDQDRRRQLSLFKEALKLRPDDYHLLRNTGVCLSLLAKRRGGDGRSKPGELIEALKYLDKAIGINPDDHKSWRQKGVVLSKLGEITKAIEHFDKALELDPDDAWAKRCKGATLHIAGNSTDALSLTREAMRTQPTIPAYKQDYSFLTKSLSLRGLLSNLDQPSPFDPPEEPTPQELPEIKAVVEHVRNTMQNDIASFQSSMNDTLKAISDFLSTSLLQENHSMLFVLRKWNSYTPSLPQKEEYRVGGGYFLHHNGIGTVIDPGYDFIENFAGAGGRIEDIDNVILTHAHNDHTIDFESILTLVYKYNDDKDLDPSKDEFKQITIYANTGSLMKFSGLIDLRGALHIKAVHTLMPDHEYPLGPGLVLRALPAYHDEIVAKDYAVGLHFKVGEGEAMRNLVFTSDTGLFPQGRKNGKTVANNGGVEIWKRYGFSPEDKIHALIVHLGSLKDSEFDANIDSESTEVFYPNHLGAIGTARIISALKPNLAIVSEFGEELRMIQESLMNLLTEIIKCLFKDTGLPLPIILPGDLSLMYDIPSERAFCVLAKDMEPLNEMNYTHLEQKDFYYYCNKEKSKLDKIKDYANKFSEHRKKGRLFYFKTTH